VHRDVYAKAKRKTETVLGRGLTIDEGEKTSKDLGKNRLSISKTAALAVQQYFAHREKSIK